MAGRADRAINMALRVLGIGEVERDFKRFGQAGEKGFTQIQKSANGAAKEVSEYTARLKRAVAEAKRMADQVPQLNKPTALSRRNRNDFVLGAVKGEQARILQGLPDVTNQFGAADAAAAGFAGRLGVVGGLAGAATLALGSVALAVKVSSEAFLEHEAALDSFNASLAYSGNRSEATAAEIEAMAQRIVASTSQTEAAVLKAAQVLATVPGITREGLEAALDVSARLADALGTDVPQQAQQTAKVLTALADGDIKGLVDATDGLNDKLRRAVIELAEAGRTADAQRTYLAGLAEAAGDGPTGLARSSNKLADAWDRVKISFAGRFADPAAAGLDWLADKLDGLSNKIAETRVNWARLFQLGTSIGVRGITGITDLGNPGSFTFAPGRKIAKGGKGGGHLFKDYTTGTSAADRAAVRAFEEKYGSGGAPRKRGGGRGGSGRSGASEAERLQREAERVREAADRVKEANEDVIASYALRAEEARAKIGLEGAALEAVERQQRIEAAVRQINTDLIEKQVAAERAAAAAAKRPFDEAKAYLDAARAVGEQSSKVRQLATDLETANAQIEAFNKRQAEAKAILDQVKTPMEKVREELELVVKLLKLGPANGGIDSEAARRRIEQLAGTVADLRHETDKAALAWEGFGQDVGRTFSDIILNGGSARDILQQLIRLPLERLLEQNVTNPIADLVDGLSGNNRDKEVKKAQAELYAASGVNDLGQQAYATARALASIQASLGVPVQELAGTTDQANQALGGLIPLTGQFSGALGQVIAMLAAQGGGGGGGFLGTVLGLAGAFAGGGTSAARVASLTPSAAGAIAANPSLFAAGTERVPVGRPFYVGENGKELMELTREGNLRVHGEARTRRFLSEGTGGTTIVQHVSVPERADPRRTASGIARATQSSIARAHRKGLASAGGK